MKKNLVFIHLESLNQAIFSHRHWFPCLNSITNHCLRLNNFISTATSSIMAVSDLLAGDDDSLEHNGSLEIGITTRRKTKTLFDELNDHGYNTAGVGYPRSWASIDNIWSDRQGFNWFDNPAQMLNKAESVIANKEQPFALYVWNLSSHLSYADAYKASGENSFERWQRGYESMDATVGDVLRLLMEHKQFENTLLVIFGDHGDDFWNHGNYGGFAHAIEPYTSLVHTPAFIFDASQKGRDINHMVSMCDLKRTALEMLGLPWTDTPASPVYNALTGERKFAFSRNLFSAQQGETPSNPLRKGYSVTSPLFHMLHVNNEVKLYAWQADSGNHFNLLSVLKQDKQGNIGIDYDLLGKGRDNGPHSHVVNFLSPGSEQVIIDNYEEMRVALESWKTHKASLA